MPQALRAPPAVARARARDFGDPLSGALPRRAHFQEQTLHRARMPLWLLGLLPPALATASVWIALLLGLARDGLRPAEVAWSAMFAFLFALAAVGLWIAALGFASGLRGRRAPVVDNSAPGRCPARRW